MQVKWKLRDYSEMSRVSKEIVNELELKIAEHIGETCKNVDLDNISHKIITIIT